MVLTERSPEAAQGGDGPRPPRPGRNLVGAVVAVALLVAIVAALLGYVVINGDSTSTTSTSAAPAAPSVTVPMTTGTTAAPATSATTPRTTPSTTAPAPSQVDTTTAVWPTASGPIYRTPAAAARGFAVDFVGFTSPIVGTFRQGDARSGEVDIRAKANGPVTTVFVRQLGATGRWFVLGSVTANINLTTPSALDKVAAPVRVQGTSTAFEANVEVEVRQDGTKASIGSGFVMGGSMGEMGPFDGTVSFRRPTAGAGALVLLTHSAEDGRVWEATVVRVSF